MPTTTRATNHGLRKICGCARARWPKCPHAWHFNFKLKGGPAYRFSLDDQLGEHIASKIKAEEAAEDLRRAIRAGTFRRRTDPAPSQPEPAPAPTVITVASFWKTVR